MENKPKSERIHELLPRLLNSKQDENWSALVEAIGEEDDRLAQLIADVRDQFFVKTANRPYIDRLASNSNIVRPRFVGIGDVQFRKYVPVLSYQPKQVKSIIDTLLDLFFFKESTTAFLSSELYAPFVLTDGWDLLFTVDGLNSERIKFNSADFSNIAAATADEVAAAYNRQAKYSYATNFYDSVTEQNYIRVFSNTIGTQGSIQIDGGLANIGFRFNGFLSEAATGANTQWSITKVGDTVTFTHTGGTDPRLDKLLVGDIFLCDLSGNRGSFVITEVDIDSDSFEFTNLLATAGSVTQTSANQTKFLRPEKITPYKVERRALSWETQGGQVTVEMPATPRIVERGLKGGFHINGSTSLVVSVDAADELTVVDATSFPAEGQFVLEHKNAITARLTGGDSDETVVYSSNGRLISNLVRYSYTGISGNTLQGITPDLPTVTQLNQVTLTALSRASGVVTCTGNNTFSAGDHVIIRGSSGITVLSTTGTATSASSTLTGIGALTGVAPGQLISGTGIPAGTKVVNILSSSSVLMSQAASSTATGSITFSEDTNGGFEILSATSGSFTYNQLGISGGAGTPGTATVERLELAETDSKVILTSARSSDDTEIIGPYIWDLNAEFVLSSHAATVDSAINAGRVIKLLDISTNTIPDEEGYLIFDYGQNNQEGPVKYLYKPADDILALDPSYIFQQNHDAGCSVVALSHRGAHTLSGFGNEYPPYVTNPSAARLILEELIREVSSAGIFIDFLIRYPSQLYGTITVYD